MFTRAEQIIALNNPLMQIRLCGYVICIDVWSPNDITQMISLDVTAIYLMTYGFKSWFLNDVVDGVCNDYILEESCKRIVEVLNEKSSITSKENAQK